MTLADALVDLASSGHPPLFHVLDQIVAQPHHTVVVDHPLREIRDVISPDTEAIARVVDDGNALQPAPDAPVHVVFQGQGYRFTHLYDTVPRVTYDTYANRFFVHFVGQFRRALATSGDPRSPALVAHLDRVGAAIPEVSVLTRFTADDPVLQHDPLYRRVLQGALELGALLRQ